MTPTSEQVAVQTAQFPDRMEEGELAIRPARLRQACAGERWRR